MRGVIDTPVLIVGGGPVGLALALELGWRTVSCTLVEQTDGRIDTPKMNEVNTRTMEFCRRWGIADRVLQCPFPDDFPMDVAVVTRLGGHELARLRRPARREQRPASASPVSLQVCSQMWFDPILRERAESFEAVRLLYRHRLERFHVGDDGVGAEVTDLRTGESLRVRAAYLVGCDGAGSMIRTALGVKLAGTGVLSRSMHLFFRSPDLFGELGVERATFFTLVDRGGVWGNLRIIDPAQGLWRLLLDVAEESDWEEIDGEGCLRRALAAPVQVAWVGASRWTRRGVVAERFSRGPVFLAGDAAHQLSPTGALGMNTGIADAADLGWKLAAAIAGWGGGNLLASYDAERRPVGSRNVAMATQYYEAQARIDCALDAIDEAGPRGEALRARAGPQFLDHITRVFRTMGLQIGYRYEHSPICIADGTPPPRDDPQTYQPTARPGCRAPHVPLADGRSILDLFGRGFVLLRLGPASPAATPLEAAAACRGVPLEVVRLEDTEAFRMYESALVLVRPDGHVAWRADALPADAQEVIDRVRGG